MGWLNGPAEAFIPPTMPPLINWYPHCYHLFSRPLALHSAFPVKRHACPPHSLYTIFPTDSDTTIVHPQPLLHMPAMMTTAAYFTIAETQNPNTIHKKPDGEVGRMESNNTGCKGYQLQVALGWPQEVFKEVQVRIISYVLTYFNIITDNSASPCWWTSPSHYLCSARYWEAWGVLQEGTVCPSLSMALL